MGDAPGVSWTGPVAAGRFCAAGGFLAVACVGAGAGGDGVATERAAGAAVAAAAGGGFGAAPAAGSGVMMLTGGVEAEVGNSALVGLPVGIDGGSAAIMPVAACGAFHDAAWRVIRLS